MKTKISCYILKRSTLRNNTILTKILSGEKNDFLFTSPSSQAFILLPRNRLFLLSCRSPHTWSFRCSSQHSKNSVAKEVRGPLLWKWVKLHGSISSYKSTRENGAFSCVKCRHSFLSDSPSESGDNVTPLVLTRRTLATTWENNRSWTIASYHNYSTILKINFFAFS